MVKLQFGMGQKVKVFTDNNYYRHDGVIGIITALYDSLHTPSRFPKCDYRVKLDGRSDPVYVHEKNIVAVVTVRAYCFRKTKNVKNNVNPYEWFESDDALVGYERFQGLDMEKEL